MEGGGVPRCHQVVTYISVDDGSTLPTPSTSKTGSLLYCGTMAGHRLT